MLNGEIWKDFMEEVSYEWGLEGCPDLQRKRLGEIQDKRIWWSKEQILPLGGA